MFCFVWCLLLLLSLCFVSLLSLVAVNVILMVFAVIVLIVVSAGAAAEWIRMTKEGKVDEEHRQVPWTRETLLSENHNSLSYRLLSPFVQNCHRRLQRPEEAAMGPSDLRYYKAQIRPPKQAQNGHPQKVGFYYVLLLVVYSLRPSKRIPFSTNAFAGPLGGFGPPNGGRWRKEAKCCHEGAERILKTSKNNAILIIKQNMKLYRLFIFRERYSEVWWGGCSC